MMDVVCKLCLIYFSRFKGELKAENKVVVKSVEKSIKKTYYFHI